jgi:hypothetical protein
LSLDGQAATVKPRGALNLAAWEVQPMGQIGRRKPKLRRSFRGLDAGEVGALAGHLKDGLNDIRKNDLRGCEAMLYSQAPCKRSS